MYSKIVLAESRNIHNMNKEVIYTNIYTDANFRIFASNRKFKFRSIEVDRKIVY